MACIATQRGEGRACRGRRRPGRRGRPLSLGHSRLNLPPIPWEVVLCVVKTLLKADLMSEVILLGFGALILGILLLILVAAWEQAPALV